MPNEQAHIRLANRNQAIIDSLLPRLDETLEWVTTIAFYKALHVVEAVFWNDAEIKHGRDHTSRECYLKNSNRYQKIYRHYRPLYAASMVARYMENGITNFSSYLGPEQVRDDVLAHDLHQLEQSAIKFLKRPGDLLCISASLAKAKEAELTKQQGSTASPAARHRPAS